MGQNGLNIGQIASKWVKMGQNGSKMGQMGSNGVKTVHNRPKWVILGLFMSGHSSKIWPKKGPKGPF